MPLSPEGGHELPPVDHAVAVVKLVGLRVHFQTGRRELVFLVFDIIKLFFFVADAPDE